MYTHRFRWLAILLILTMLVTACGSDETVQPSTATQAAVEQPTAKVAAQPTEAPAPTPTSMPPTPTPVPPTPSPTPEPAEQITAEGIVAPNEALDSYRSRSTTTLLESEGNAEFPMAALLFGNRVIEIEFIREPESTHVTMTMTDMGGAIETIAIGDQTWINMGTDWMSVPANQDTSAAQSSQIDVNEMLRDMVHDMQRLGKDTVNGIDCQRYTVDSEFALPLPTVDSEIQAMMPTDMGGTIKGEVCVADEHDLPRVIIQEQSVYEVTLKYASGAEEKVRFEQESELFDINEPFTIEPPE
jgi:hypothetical protein